VQFTLLMTIEADRQL